MNNNDDNNNNGIQISTLIQTSKCLEMGIPLSLNSKINDNNQIFEGYKPVTFFVVHLGLLGYGLGRIRATSKI